MPDGAERAARNVWRLRHVTACAALAALAFLQAPGLTVLDTKVDLTVDPVSWLARSLHLWYPASGFGQVQNQAYGYLWPIGPFFAAGSFVGLPAWAVQRLWWALLLCLAYTGLVRLASRLGIGTPTSRLIAGVAFALSPRILTELGTISIEAWPMALAPWVLVPLIGLARGHPIRRGVALSAIAVACAGGVNATAVLAVVPLALLWLAFLRPLRRRLQALTTWCLVTAMATAWWVVPLLVLGRYSPRFLDYIETARTTTRVTDLVTVVRGTSHWLTFLSSPYGPMLPAGFDLATRLWLIAATLVVAGLGIVGLARAGLPHRRFLVTGLLVGLALVGMGHVTVLDGGLAAMVRDFLDGAGAPLRNVHKFDVVLRIPLVLGLAHLLGTLERASAVAGKGWHSPRLRLVGVGAAALAGLVGVASPAFAGALPTQGSYPEVPAYWYQAGAWLDGHTGHDHVLVLPGARFPYYTWGRPSDEVIQALTGASWAVRSDIPLTPPATIRFLDSVQSVLDTGNGSAGLADVLARSGVRYVLIRSDLDYGRSATTRPILVRQALARSAGLESVASFGPMLGESHGLADSGLNTPVRALEVFEVKRPVEQVVAYDGGSVTTVVGGPEALLPLAAAGQLPDGPTVLAGDSRPGLFTGPVAITDSLRRREIAFGLSRDSASATLTADEPFGIDGPAHDYLPSWAATQQTVATYGGGITDVSASSSWAQVEPLIGSRPEHLPFAAVDGDPNTSWRTSPGVPPIGQWLEVTLAAPTTVTKVQVNFDGEADFLPTKVTVSAGIEEVTSDVDGSSVTVTLPGQHATRRIRVTVEDASIVRFGAGSIGINEFTVDAPGLAPYRTLVVPSVPTTVQPASVVLEAAPTSPSCVFADGLVRCAAGLRRGSEDGDRLDRTVTLPASGIYTANLTARPRPGFELSQLLDQVVAAAAPLGLLPSVSASSTGIADPARRPGSILDGNSATAWSPAAGDHNPWLRLNWFNQRTVTGMRLTTDAGVAATPVKTVTVVGDDGLRNGRLNDDGMVTFDPPLHTDELTIVFPETAPTASFDPYYNGYELLPVAVGEVRVLPDPENHAWDSDRSVVLACGSGPTLHLGDQTIRTALTVTGRDLLELREVPAQPCDSEPSVSLPAGSTRLTATGTDLADPVRLALNPKGAVRAAAATPVTVGQWSSVERHLTLPAHAGDRVLAVRENINAGWRATAGGQVLQPITVDGWQQGWLVPAGYAGEVVLRFTPDQPYRAGLVGGAGSLALVVLLAVLPSRRRGAHHQLALSRQGRRDWVLPGVVGGLALLLVGGAAFAVLATAAAVAFWAWRLSPLPDTAVLFRRHRRLVRAARWWLPVAGFGLAAWWSVSTVDDHGAAAPQAAALVSATALWLSVTVAPRRRDQRAAQR
jgi:arabinofuranan 3-O-arabinosyltransferase